MSRRPDYRTAPLKAISRQMISEIARRMVPHGAVSEMTYVGLGGLEFTDFAVLYDALGLESMYSIEDTEPAARVDFNRPSERIVNLKGTTNERLPEIDELGTARSIVWLDYTSPMTPDIQRDLAYLAGKMLPGSAIFTTFNAHFTESTKLEDLEQRLGDYWDDFKLRDFLSWKGADLQLAIAEQVMERVLDSRQDEAKLLRVLDLRYKDTARMQVAGWIITNDPDATAEKCGLAELEFSCTATGNAPVLLAWPDLTPGEWNWLHRQMPSADPLVLVRPHEHVSDQTLRDFASVHRYARRRLSA